MKFELDGQIFEFDDSVKQEEALAFMQKKAPAQAGVSASAPSVTKPDDGLLSKAGQSLMASAESIPEAALGVAQAPVALLAEATKPYSNLLGIEDPLEKVSERIGEARQGYSERAEAKRPDTTGLNFAERALVNVPESLTSNLVVAAGAMLPGGTSSQITTRAVKALGLMVGGSEFGEAKDKGLETLPAFTYGAGQGIVEAAMEALPLGKLFGDIAQGAGLGSILWNQIKQEIPTEQATTFLQDLNTQAMLTPDRPWSEFWNERLERAGETAVATVAQTGLMTGGVVGLNKAVGAIQENRQKTNEARVEAEIQAMAEEMGLVGETDANGMPITQSNNHTQSGTLSKLADAIPMWRDENGTLTNARLGGKREEDAEIVPIAGEGVKLLDGSVKQAVEAGDIAFNTELKTELENGTFTDPEAALRIAATIQLQSEGVTHLHEVGETGQTRSSQIYLESQENLIQQFNALKSENGLPIGVTLTERGNTDTADTSFLDGQLSREEELRYKILNPIDEETRERMLARLKRMEEGKNIAEVPDAIAVDELDSFWSREVARGTFEPEGLDPDSGGITQDVAEAREERFQEEVLPPSLRTINVSSNMEAEGLTLRQVSKQPGTYGIGGNEKSFPREYQEAVVRLAEAVRTKYMDANSTLVINFENFGKERTTFGNLKLDAAGLPISNIMGAHTRLKDGTHVITPRELASWDERKNAYNPVTVNEAIYSLTHELGHAVWLNEFYRNMTNTQQMILENYFKSDNLTAIKEMLDELPSAEAAVIAEWIAKREELVNRDARWFLENWVGVRKLGLGVGKYKNKAQQRIYEWGERELAKRGMRLDGATALDMVHALYWDSSLNETEAKQNAEQYILSFTEYMAEQFTRHAYQAKIAESTLSDNPFFIRALNALRNFFKELKTSSGLSAEAVVKAGDSFEAWVSGLSHVYGNIDNAEIAGKRKVRKKVSVNRKTEKTPEIVAALPDEATQLEAQAAIAKSFNSVLPLVKRQYPDFAEELEGYIEHGDFESAQILVRELLGREINFDKTYSTKLLNALPRREFYSAEFLMNFAKQPWVRKGDKNAIAAIIDEYGTDGKIPFSALESAIIVYALPLQAEASTRYEGEGFEEIGLEGQDVTIVLTSAENTWFDSHFSNEELQGYYFAHYRGTTQNIDGKSVFSLVEAQSDILQKLGSKREYGTGGGVVDLAQENEDFKYEEPVTYEKLKNISKDWHVRILREIVADAYTNKIDTIRIAHENVMALAEGWIGRWILTKPFPRIETTDSAIAGKSIIRSSDQTELTFTGDIVYANNKLYAEIEDVYGVREILPFEEIIAQTERSTQSLDIRDYFVKLFNEYNSGLVGDFNIETDIYAEQQDDLVLTKVQGIYLRHKEMRMLAEQMYGARKVFDENGMLWYEFDLDKSMETVLAYDASSPEASRFTGPISVMQKLKNKAINKSMNFTARLGQALIQLQQQAAENPQIVPLQVFNKLQQDFTRLKNSLMFRPQTVATEWMKLSANESKMLEKLMREEKSSGTHQTKLVKTGAFYAHTDSAEFDAWLTSKGLDLTSESGKTVKDMFLKIKNSHQHQFNVLESVLRDLLWKKFNRDTAVFGEKWREYQRLFTEMRETPFLPSMQFGNFVLYVQQQVPDANGKLKMTTVFRRQFESKSERDEMYLKLKAKEKTGEQVKFENLKESQAVTMAIPYDFLQVVADTGQFAQDQVTLLQELLIPTRAEKFEKRWRQFTDETPGASDNLFRNYVAYSWHNANFIAKLKYNPALNTAIQALRSETNRLENTKNSSMTVEQRFAELEKRKRILDNLVEIKKDLMYPSAEFEALRSSISLLYLNFMIKTAIMNLSTMFNTVFGAQVEYGEIKGSKAFTKSLSLIRSAWGEPTAEGGLKFSTIEARIANSTGAKQAYWKNIKYALDRATHEGVIDQSFAYMLAGMATSGTRMKMYQKYPRSRYIHNAIDMGMIPFRAVEKMNRLASVLTFFELELERNGGDAQAAYEHAAKRTLILQNDYSKGNRPKLLRGKKSLVTIFLSYSQFVGWLVTGGQDRTLRAEAEAKGIEYKGPMVNFTARMWILYWMLGGMMGAPFAENIMDLLNFIGKKFFNNAELEYQLRKFIQDTTGHENLIMHGLLHNVPTPLGGIDLSASFGAGRLIPGTSALGDYVPGENLASVLGQTAIGVTGVTGAFVNSMWNFANAESSSQKLKSLPGILGQIGKAYDGYEYGIMTKAGQRILVDPETGEQTEGDAGLAALQVMGFNPADVSAERKKNSMQYVIARYYNAKRTMLLRNKNFAEIRNDKDGVADAMQDIKDFNESLPKDFNGMSITQKTMNRSLKLFRDRTQKAESGQSPTKAARGIYSSVEEVFEE